MGEVEGHEARVCTGAKQLKLDSNKTKDYFIESIKKYLCIYSIKFH